MEDKIFSKTIKPKTEEFDPTTEKAITYISEMKNDISNICNELIETKIDKQEIYRKVLEYVADEKRILYSQITTEIFGYYNNDTINNANERVQNMTINLQLLYAYSIENKDYLRAKYSDERYTHALDSMPKVFLKMWDHINLAERQYHGLKQTDEEFAKKFEKSIEPTKTQFLNQVNGQLITLVGIFTALAFLVFGGITNVDNAFGAQSVSILRLMMTGSIWGLFIVNLIFIFLLFVGRMVNVNFFAERVGSNSVFRRFPIAFWADFILCSILLISGWLYYLKNRQGLDWLDEYLQKNPQGFTLVGTAILLAILFLIFVLLTFITRKKN